MIALSDFFTFLLNKDTEDGFRKMREAGIKQSTMLKDTIFSSIYVK
jgi:hypothetical protein